MSVVGDFTIPAGAFALEDALSFAPETTVQADELATHSPREVFPFLWATGSDPAAFEDALAADGTVTDISVAMETDSEVLYRLEWTDEFCALIHDMVDHHAAILEATGARDHWSLRLRFANEEFLSEFQDHFEGSGHRFEVQKLYHPTEPRQRAFGLTADQHEALTTAVKEGYFDVPRTASTEDVSEVLGISANATSERIRRGCAAMVRAGLIVPDPED